MSLQGLISTTTRLRLVVQRSSSSSPAVSWRRRPRRCWSATDPSHAAPARHGERRHAQPGCRAGLRRPAALRHPRRCEPGHARRQPGELSVGMSIMVPCVDASGQVLTPEEAATAAASMEAVVAAEGPLRRELDTLFGPVALFPDQVLTPVLVAVDLPARRGEGGALRGGAGALRPGARGPGGRSVLGRQRPRARRGFPTS